MGYETKAVIVVDAKQYSNKELHPWIVKWIDYLDEKLVEEHRVVFVLEWAKGTHLAVEDFLDNYVHHLEDENGNSYQDLDTFGIVSIGEDYSDTEEHGTPWEFDVNLNRSIEIY